MTVVRHQAGLDPLAQEFKRHMLPGLTGARQERTVDGDGPEAFCGGPGYPLQFAVIEASGSITWEVLLPCLQQWRDGKVKNIDVGSRNQPSLSRISVLHHGKLAGAKAMVCRGCLQMMAFDCVLIPQIRQRLFASISTHLSSGEVLIQSAVKME